MKRSITAVTFAIALGALAPAAFAMGGHSQLENSIRNQLNQIDSSIVLPDLSDTQLAKVRSLLNETDDSNSEKSAKVRFYISNL